MTPLRPRGEPRRAAAGASGPTRGPAWCRAVLIAAALLAPAGSAGAQVDAASRFPGPGAPPGPWKDAVAADSARSLLARPGGAFVASLIVPGAGQAALGLRRWVVYGVVEAGLWVAHVDARSDRDRFTRRYRDLAWDVARYPRQEPRRDGSWGYYEAMSHYTASGAFDVDPAQPGIQPEPDAGTYNGSVWELARGLFLPGGVVDPASPAYASAIAYYQERAAGPDFLWTWAGREGEMEQFLDLIDAADDESRRATGVLGLILANHLTSAIDALIVARLRDGPGPELDSELVPSGSGPRLRLGLRLPLDF